MEGSLEQTHISNRETGFLAFIRLMGTCYFKRHLSAFVSNKGHLTPVQLFNSIDPFLLAKESYAAKYLIHLISYIVTTSLKYVKSIFAYQLG